MSSRPARFAFLDVLRGIAIILMVVNHTSRWWLDMTMDVVRPGQPVIYVWRYWLVYGSMLLPAAIFLFLVGFCLPIPMRRGAVAAGGGLRPLPPFWPTMRGYARRGARIILAGLLLNVVVFNLPAIRDEQFWSGGLLHALSMLLVFHDEPFWNGGVLQTIGAAVIVVAPSVWLVRHAWGRVAVLAVGVAAYVAYFVALPALRAWSHAHPVLAQIALLDFPPWPWISAALLGVVLGWWWLDAREAGPASERRYFVASLAVGLAGLAAYAAWEWWRPTTPGFGFPRDLMLNGHWTPRGATLLYIAGGLGTLLTATYWATEVRGWRLRWLVVLGNTALMLYFLHQLLAYTLLGQAGLRFTRWWQYWAANVVFIIVLLAISTVWLRVRPRVRELLTRVRGGIAGAPGGAGSRPARTDAT